MSLTGPAYIDLDVATFELRVSDRLPSFVAQVVDDRGNPVDLTDAVARVSARRIAGRSADGTYDWTGPFDAQIVDATEGVVYYDWQPEDTVTYPGVFHLVIIITFSDDTGLVVPTDQPVKVTLRDPLDVALTELLLTLEDGTVLTTSGDVALVVTVDGVATETVIGTPGVFV